MTVTFSDLDRGWSWMVMMASFAAGFVVGGVCNSMGIVHTTLLEMYHENQATTSLVGALHGSITCLAAPLCSMVIDKFSTRTAFVTSGILYTVGFFTTSFSPSIGVTIFTCGIIAGLGGAFGMTASAVSVGFYFRRYRNAAQGFANSGHGVGTFVMAPLMQKAIQVFGRHGLFVILACVSVQMFVFGTATIPSKLELHTQRKRKDDLNRKDSTSSSTLAYFKRYLKLLTTKSIACLSLSFFLFYGAHALVFLYLPNYCIHQGVSHMQASFALSLVGASSICGRLATGLAASYKTINEVTLYSGSQIIAALATALFPFFSNTHQGQIVYAVLFGLFFGTPFVTIMPMNINYVGVSRMASAIGIEFCCGGLGGIVLPVLAGFVLDGGGTYQHVFIMGGAAFFLSSVLGLISCVLSKQEHTDDESEADMEIRIKDTAASQTMLGHEADS